jgi:hypothetical protein
MRRPCATLLFAVVLYGCGSDSLAPPAGAPLVSGEIVAVGPPPGPLPPGSLAKVHIRPFSQSECGVVFDVTLETEILVVREGRTSRGDVGDLVLHVSASGWTDSAVQLSCPAAASASFIEINHDLDVE